jgi:hypothetical protein
MNIVYQVAKDFTTPLIASFVGGVAWLQWRTAMEKLRLDLYDRRFAVYANALDFMQALYSWVSVEESLKLTLRQSFVRSTREARFLFADDARIFALLDQFNTRSFHVTGYRDHMARYAQSMPEETLQAYKQNSESLLWIGESIGRLETLLMPYLAFGQQSPLLSPIRFIKRLWVGLLAGA